MSYIPYHHHFHKSRVPYTNDLYHSSDPSYNTSDDTENPQIDYNITATPSTNELLVSITNFNDNINSGFTYNILVEAI